MALPVWRAAGTLMESITTLTCDAHPAGLATDDIELLICETMDQAVSLTTTGGYVEVTGSPVSAPSATATIATRATIFWRRYAAQADAITDDPGNHVIATQVAISDCITTGNPWDITVASAEEVEDTSGSMTGGTTTVADCLVVAITCHAKPDIAGGTAEMSAHANADLANVTERFDDAAASGNGGWIGIITGEKAASGTFAATTYTKATASFKANLVIALKPPSGTTTPQTVTATVGTSATMVRQAGKVVSSSVATAATLSRQVAKTVSASVATSATLIKQMTKTVTASVATTASLTAIRVFLVDLTAIVGTTTTLTRQVAKSVSASVATTASASRQVGKIVTASVATTAAMTKGIAKTLTATAGAAAAMSREVGKTLTMSVGTLASLVADFVSGAGAVVVKFFDEPTPAAGSFDEPTPTAGHFDEPTPT